MTENGEKPNCRLSGFFFRWPINSTQSLSLSLKHQNPWTLKDEAEVIKHSIVSPLRMRGSNDGSKNFIFMSLIGTCGHSIIEHNICIIIIINTSCRSIHMTPSTLKERSMLTSCCNMMFIATCRLPIYLRTHIHLPWILHIHIHQKKNLDNA